ncbi:MAG: CorA family divalent cation transporter, partial [Lautropia sp.]|nr:CorA family divalent cation transporter [Lautropia sp.]
VRARAERETELLKLGPAFVLYAITDAVVDRFFPIIERLETDLENVETRIFQEQPSRKTMEILHLIKQHVVELRHTVPAVRDDAAFRIAGGGNSTAIRQELHDYYRDVSDHVQRINQSLEGLRDNVSMAAQVNLSLISLEQSEVSKKLAAWAAIFGMMTTLAGIWGMNFEFMPELKLTWGYPVALSLMAIIGILLYRRFRKVGWL